MIASKSLETIVCHPYELHLGFNKALSCSLDLRLMIKPVLLTKRILFVHMYDFKNQKEVYLLFIC